jgi:hypothetical protein
MQRLSNDLRSLLAIFIEWKERSQKLAWFDSMNLVWGPSVRSDQLPGFVGKMWEEQVKNEAKRSAKSISLKIPGLTDVESLKLLAPLIVGRYQERAENSRKVIQIDFSSIPPRVIEVERLPDQGRLQAIRQQNDFYEESLLDTLRNSEKRRELFKRLRGRHAKTGTAMALSKEIDGIVNQLERQLQNPPSKTS